MRLSGFRYRGEEKALDDAARAAAPGRFINLPKGKVHYELGGPPEGRMVVLIHGFSVPFYIWDPTFAALTEAGHRVLRYDLYGRGYSDRPDVDYGAELYERQLLDLLAALEVEGPVDLVGLSMGGAIAVWFADRHPERVGRLCLIDPAGLPVKRHPLQGLLFAPLLGELMMSYLGERVMLQSLTQDVDDPELLESYMDLYREPMRIKGFRRALLSTLRSGFLNGLEAHYARVGRQARPMALIWGRNDRTVPFETSEQVRALMPSIDFFPIDETGHIPHYERPEVVNPILIGFLER